MKTRARSTVLFAIACAASACAADRDSAALVQLAVNCDAATEWTAGSAYAAGAVVTFGGETYECIQAHTSQPDWTPTAVPALWGIADCDGGGDDGGDDVGDDGGDDGGGDDGGGDDGGGDDGGGDGGDPGASKKVAYYAQWSAYTTGRNFQIQDVDQLAQAGKLTHINYAFANINEQGRCFEANQAGVGDAWADYQWRLPPELSVDGVGDVFNQPLAGNFNQIKKLKARHPHLRVLMSIGGWTWSRYFSNAALPQNRAAFVASCIDLFIKGNLPMLGGEPQGGAGAAFGVFDGIDLDWEWPASEGAPGNVIRPEDRENFTALLQEFRSQLDAYGAEVGRQYLLSAFLPASPAKISVGFQGQIFDHLDYATVQGYDFYGSWEPQTNHQSQIRSPAANPNPQKFSIEIAIDSWLDLGASPEQLVMGIPAYGRGWTGVANVGDGVYQSGTAAPGQFEAGVDDYKLVKNKPGTVFRDASSGAVWKYDGNNFWSYDDPQLVRDKASYVRGRGLGGMMLWSLDGDDGTLVDAMHTGLQ